MADQRRGREVHNATAVTVGVIEDPLGVLITFQTEGEHDHSFALDQRLFADLVSQIDDVLSPFLQGSLGRRH